MKIAIIAELNKPIQKNSLGGTEIWTYNFAEELVKRGHDVTIFARKESKTAAKLQSICKLRDLRMGKEGKLSRDKLSLSLTQELVEAVKLQEQFDIIHLSIFSFYLGLPYSALITKPFVITLHGYCNINKNESKAYFSKYQNPYFVFPTNSFLKNWNKPHHYRVINHGIDLKKFSFSEKRENYFFWMGRITESKGVEDAIKFANRTGEKLVIAGSIDDPEYFKKNVKPYLKKNIKYVGELHFKQKIEYYKNAKALLFLPRIKEAFGLVAVEAMACGMPVIAFDQDPMNEIIENNKNGIVVKTGDIKALISASKKISNIDCQYCRQTVENRFDQDKMINEYLDLYRTLHG